ncbi:MAG: hypothetical protein AUH92_01250 [Acidobacteria bacterium 13_1_40CM_4_69_4]|nr:MAG: hypothetical protein AUH92_01250 [Acidobacteria bacterium 13_1_40CM_4_69_4]
MRTRGRTDRRATLLLRLGSDRDEKASPRPGFEARLRARTELEGAARQVSAWTEGFETLVRPALALAAALVIVCAGFCVQGTSQPGEADLASLVETDAVFDSLMAGDPGILFEDPWSVPAPRERP